MANKLNTGDAFPKLDLRLSEGKILTVPDNLQSSYTALLFYRGHW